MRTLKRVVLITMAAMITVWIGGAIFLVKHIHFYGDSCKKPFYAYVATWPLWYVAPMDFLVWTQVKANDWCDD